MSWSPSVPKSKTPNDRDAQIREFATLYDRNQLLVSEVRHIPLWKAKTISEMYGNQNTLVLGGGILLLRACEVYWALPGTRSGGLNFIFKTVCLFSINMIPWYERYSRRKGQGGVMREWERTVCLGTTRTSGVKSSLLLFNSSDYAFWHLPFFPLMTY